MKRDTPRLAALPNLVRDDGGPAAFVKKRSRRDLAAIDASYISQLLNYHRSFGEKAARTLQRQAGLKPPLFDDAIAQRQALAHAIEGLSEDQLSLITQMANQLKRDGDGKRD